MKMLLPILAVVALLGSCRTAADERAAMRTALEAHLSQRGNLNLAGMDMEIRVLRQDARSADIQVQFRAKQGGGSMQMAYTLERQGNGWLVKGSRTTAGDSAHPDVGGAPATSPAPGGLPSGHPPITPSPQTPTKRP